MFKYFNFELKRCAYFIEGRKQILTLDYGCAIYSELFLRRTPSGLTPTDGLQRMMLSYVLGSDFLSPHPHLLSSGNQGALA